MRAWMYAALGGVAIAAALGCQSVEPLGDSEQQFRTGLRGVTLRTGLESVRERRFRGVVPQQRDYSCGAAALATLLQFHYEDPIEEAQIIVDMLQTGDAERIRRQGFSLLDLKHYAEKRGYDTRGFRVGAEVLERLAIPSITLVNTRGYNHFVVLRGARDGMVYLADPSMGQRAVPQPEFLSDWEGVVFFVAARRKSDQPSLLEMQSVARTAPTDWVQELDGVSWRRVVSAPLEF